jgi:hypothetical protein
VIGVLLIPTPVEVFGDQPELDNQNARKIERGGLTALFSPETVEGLFVLAHDDPGIRAADELAAVVYCSGAVNVGHSSAIHQIGAF